MLTRGRVPLKIVRKGDKWEAEPQNIEKRWQGGALFWGCSNITQHPSSFLGAVEMSHNSVDCVLVPSGGGGGSINLKMLETYSNNAIIKSPWLCDPLAEFVEFCLRYLLTISTTVQISTDNGKRLRSQLYTSMRHTGEAKRREVIRWLHY